MLTTGVLLLGGLVSLMISQSRSASQLSICKSNLLKLGMGMELFSNAAQEPTLPAGLTNEPFGEVPPSAIERLSKMIQSVNDPRLLFICPADVEAVEVGPHQPTGATISYFISDEAAPQSWALLAGDRNLTSNGAAVESGLFELMPNSIVGWTAKGHHLQGNVALGDGSVQTKDGSQLTQYLRQGRGPQTIVVP